MVAEELRLVLVRLIALKLPGHRESLFSLDAAVGGGGAGGAKPSLTTELGLELEFVLLVRLLMPCRFSVIEKRTIFLSWSLISLRTLASLSLASLTRSAIVLSVD